jgi:pyruvate/2-oxoglutarate dehydrogenase complex dihydrolipoamide acyltransferase (E2) component
MAVEVVMPALGMAHERGRLVRWLKREGELVAYGEPLLEVESEKAVVAVESPGAGVLSGIRVREGEEVVVGAVLAYLLAPAAQPGEVGVARALAERASRSWREVPHLFLLRDVDASQLIVAGSAQPPGVTRADVLLRLVAVTLVRHPALLAGRDEVDLAVTIPADTGTSTPVIRGADRLALPALAARRAELEARVRAGDLRPSDLGRVPFAVCDLSGQGADAFLPLVGEGQAGCLGVGRAADRVVPVGGMPQVRPVLTLTLACDGRTVDPVRAARLLRDLAEALEEPARHL